MAANIVPIKIRNAYTQLKRQNVFQMKMRSVSLAYFLIPLSTSSSVLKQSQ